MGTKEISEKIPLPPFLSLNVWGLNEAGLRAARPQLSSMKLPPLLDFIRTMPTSDPHATARGNEYVQRLKTYIRSKAVK